jgi:hypothetical protein
VVNSIRIGIADVGDSNRPSSNLLIANGSIQSDVLAGHAFDVVLNGAINVLANDVEGNGTLTITLINGRSVSVGGTVTLATGAPGR